MSHRVGFNVDRAMSGILKQGWESPPPSRGWIGCLSGCGCSWLQFCAKSGCLAQPLGLQPLLSSVRAALYKQ